MIWLIISDQNSASHSSKIVMIHSILFGMESFKFHSSLNQSIHPNLNESISFGPEQNEMNFLWMQIRHIPSGPLSPSTDMSMSE